MGTHLLAAGIITYANARGLDRTLKSLQGITDINIVVHAKFASFGYYDDYSLIETKHVCSKYPNTRLIIIMPEEESTYDQIYCRNMYMKNAKDCDFLLVIDDDEYVELDKKEELSFRDKLEAIDDSKKLSQYRIFSVDYFDPILGVDVHRGRIFYKPSTVRYHGKHYWYILTDQNNRFINGESDSPIPYVVRGIRLVQDDKLRSKEYEDAYAKYEQWQKWNEKIT